MMPEKRLPVMRVSSGDLARRALVVGDPARAETASRLLQEARKVGENREYHTYSGIYGDQWVTICSHGVGAAGASICFSELMQGGVRTLIRAGTCGALVKEIEDGSLVIANGAIRSDGTTDQLIPLEYPAIADADVTRALETAALKAGCSFHKGIVLSQAHFYPGLLPGKLGMWMRAGAVGVEMELAALLVIASLNGARAGGILTSDGNLARHGISMESYTPDRDVVRGGIQTMLQVALEALTRMPE